MNDLDTRFHALHAGGLLRLPNAWDAGSARLAASAGAGAFATSSCAVAWTHAWPDGDLLPHELLLSTVRAITGAVDIPVSVDVEGGYSDDPMRVGELVSAVVGAGAVGINVEDGSAAPELLCAKIAAAREAGRRHDVELFINARTDVFLRGLAPAGERVAEVLRREALYRAAGANGIFVPGATQRADIEALVAGVRLPLNLMADATIDPAGLEALGVRRYSAGGWIAKTLHALALSMMREFAATGRMDSRGIAEMAYGELNAIMKR